MTLNIFGLVLLSLLFISSGQMLFKYVSILLNKKDEVGMITVIFYGLLSFFVSGMGTVVWMYILRFIELNKIYPYMALTFIFVPIMSYFLYSEKLSIQYFFGLLFIIVGLYVITKGNN